MARRQRSTLFAAGERSTVRAVHTTHHARLLLLTVALFAGGAVAGPVPPALAATFTANSTADEPDLDLSDGLCLTAAGDCTLRAAVQQANAFGGGPHTIALLAGATYTLTRAGAGEDAAARGDLDLATALLISVPGGRAVVQAASGFGDRVFDVLFGATVELNGLEITGGEAGNGGGIFIFGGTLTLTNSTVSGNRAGDSGGIVNGGTLTLTDSTVSGNSAVGDAGGIGNGGTMTLTNSTVSGNSAGGSVGGIWNSGSGFANIGTLTLTNSTVSGNSAADGFAGGIYNEAGTLTLTNSAVSGNSATFFGGGLVNSFEGATLRLNNSAISGNSAGVEGGGLVNNIHGTLTATNSTVSGNRAGEDGGAFYNSSQLALTNSTVSGNSAGGDGGGLVNSSDGTLTNSTVSGNSALGDGGGIWNRGTVTANNVTIAKNVADANADDAGNGGGMFNVSGGTVRIANTIIGTNVDRSRTILAARQAPDCAGSLTSQGHNLIQTTTGCAIGGDTTGNITGRDPKLGPLQDNGGPTLTHALLVVSELGGLTFASPAIDAGNLRREVLCENADQRGVGRPLDGNADGVARCDIGAYEYVAPPFKLGTWALAPEEATVRPGERLTYELTWTVPPPRGWRSLNTLELRFVDDGGTALWARFQKVAGSPGVFSVVDPRNGRAGPSFAPGSPNQLESKLATLYLAASSVDGPPGPAVTLSVTLSFKPHAARRVYDVLVARPTTPAKCRASTAQASSRLVGRSMDRRVRTLLVGLVGLALALSLAPAALADWVSVATLNEGRIGATATLLNDGRVLVAGGALATLPFARKTAEIYDPETDTWSVAASMAVPHVDHTATLLPNGKVLVVGGFTTTTVEIYDPATNTWSLTGPLPSGHGHFEGHTATRLPNGKVVVTGGRYSQDADLYDPITNTWSAAATMSTARIFSTATLLPNGKVLVAGGQETSSTFVPLATAELYEPATNTWSAAGAMSTARLLATATLLPDGKVLVAGGTQDSYFSTPPPTPLATAELYDPVTNRWFPVASMRNARLYHTATPLANGKVLVAGSFRLVEVEDEPGQFHTETRTSPSVELYDPVTNSWRTEPSMSFDRGQHTATLLRSGRVLMAGGTSESNPVLLFAETYQPPRPLWSETTPMATPRELHTATPLPDGRVLVAGGLDTATGVLTSAELFDPAADTWSPAGNMAFPRYDFGAARLQDGRVLVAGGDNFSVGTPQEGPLASAELYDPAANTWSPAASMATRRARLNLVRLATGKVLAVGGYTRVGSEITVLASAELYDPVTNTWSDAGSMSAPRQFFTAVLLDDGRVLAVGGTNASGVSLASADLYDPVTNSWSPAATLNEGRVSHTATNLPGGKVLVTGGFRLAIGPPLSSAELYDPSTDTWADAGRMQTARQLHAATLLPGGEVLVTGGLDYTNVNLWSSELYVPATNSWGSAPSLNTPRAVHTSTLLTDGRVLVVGGENTDLGSRSSAEVTKALGVALSLTKEDSPDPVTVGGNVTYHLTVSNDGGDIARGVTVTDELPPSVVLVSATPNQGSCAGTATVTCALGSLADGASATIEIVVSTRTATTIVNRASVHDDQDPGTADATARASTTVNAPATFSVNSPADQPDGKPGDGKCLTGAGTCTLRAAVQEANALGPGGRHTVELHGGETYTLSRAGAGEDDAATGDLDVVADLTISVTGGTAVVRGASGWDDRLFDVWRSGAAVELRGLQIQNGVADPGGAIWNVGALALTNSTVSNNSADQLGGGIYNSGTLMLTNSTVSGNSAELFGGGIYNVGALTLANSTVNGNSARNGGGIYNAAGALTLTSSTVSGNSALGDGGGIWNIGTVTANNVTIAKNVADADSDDAGNGGGMFNVSGGTVRVANTIVGTNVDQSRTIFAGRQAPDCVGSLTSQGYNLVQTTTGCTIGGDTIGNITGRDPQLGPLQDNGGPTFTHALLVLTSKLGPFTIPSPAIDAGSPGGATACPSRDQTGGLRVDGNADGISRCDIGAYEYVPPLFKLGTWALTPAETTVRPGERLAYELTWTVPPPRGWRSLDSLDLRFLDDRGTALWVRFQEITGSPGVFSVVDPRNGRAGPSFAPGSPSRLESTFSIVYLEGSSVDGPPGPSVTVTLMLSFKPHAAGRTYDVLVGATDDGGEVQGFHRAGAVTVTG